MNKKIKIVLLGLVFLGLRMQYKTDYDKMIFDISRKYKVNGNLVKAIIKVESNFNPSVQAINEKENSRGLMQINQPTALGLGLTEDRLHTLFNPETNINYGCLLLFQLKNRYKKLKDVIASYNYGSVKKTNNKYINQNYVNKVYNNYLLYTISNPLQFSF